MGLEPREGFEPSFPPYQGGGLPLTYLGLFYLVGNIRLTAWWLSANGAITHNHFPFYKWSIGVISRLQYLGLYLSS